CTRDVATRFDDW
nr:immunoglobulin heavy chain junction region [Macaca mulatta]